VLLSVDATAGSIFPSLKPGSFVGGYLAVRFRSSFQTSRAALLMFEPRRLPPRQGPSSDSATDALLLSMLTAIDARRRLRGRAQSETDNKNTRYYCTNYSLHFVSVFD
jgi:hypothetical protein